MTRRVLIGVAVLSALVLPARAARAQTTRFALVVEGASGGDEFAGLHRHWLDSLVSVLRDTFGFDAAHLTVLSETPGAGEQKSTAENVRTALAALARQIKTNDQLFVMLIGHGGGMGADAKFNLVGPDLTATEWNALLKPIQGRIAFVDTTSGSFGYLAGLAGPQRVIITATNSQAQQYHAVFAEGFIEALTSPAADLDKNGRISMWEAFAYASRQVGQYYEQKGTMATEHAALDDTGEGVGRLATAASPGDSLANLTYLDAPARTTSTDPQVQALIAQRDALEEKVDELRRTRRMMAPADFDQAFEKLIVDLAMVSREIRRKTGG